MSPPGASSWWVVVACLPLLGAACVSPDSFVREGADGGDIVGTGGSSGGGQGGSGNGVGGRGLGGNGNPGLGGAVGTGGRSGVGGRGQGGTVVIGPTANLMDNFETGDVGQRWFWDGPTADPLHSSTSPPCGDWTVVSDGATNHVFQQAATCSGPSWAAGGNVDWTDMRLQARVRFPAGATTSTRIMLGVRFKDDRTQVYTEFTNDGKYKIRVRIEAGGAPSDITNASSARVAVPAGQWVTLGLSVSGGTVNAYLGEDRSAPPVLTGAATGVVNGGIGIGVLGGAASFDDILVTPP